MVEGRVHTHGTLSAVRQRCERAASLKRLPSTEHRNAGVLTRTARANASLRVQVARAPPRAPTLASHGLNVRCKKTYRAAQRTHRILVYQ